MWCREFWVKRSSKRVASVFVLLAVAQLIPDSAAEDSISLLPLLEGKKDTPVRERAVSQGSSGLTGIRQGFWKLIFGPGSGGWGKGTDAHPAQLYELQEDLAETNNLYVARPNKVGELTALMEKIVNDGRSTPGAPQQNDHPIHWQRFMKATAE